MKRRQTDASDGAKRFGAWLRRARKVRGITQGELAIRAGVSFSSISYIETGHRDPTIGTVLQLADALGYRMIFADKRELAARRAGTASTRASDAAEGWACGRKDGAGPALSETMRRRMDTPRTGGTMRRRTDTPRTGGDDEEEDG